MNITVYLGANEGSDPALGRAVRELGQWIGGNGHTLVYGGSENGLMGEIAKSVLASGGKAIGVEPQFFIDAGYEYDGLTELIITKDMAERKGKMIELGDKVSESEKAPVQAAIEKLKEANKGNDVEAIKAATDECQKAFYAISEKLYKNAAPQDGGAQGGNGTQGGDDGVVDADYEEVKD